MSDGKLFLRYKYHDRFDDLAPRPHQTSLDRVNSLMKASSQCVRLTNVVAMNRDEDVELRESLTRHGATEVAEVHTYSGYISGHGEVIFRVKDIGRTPRWSIQAFNESGELIGADVEDFLSVAVVGVFNKFR